MTMDDPVELFGPDIAARIEESSQRAARRQAAEDERRAAEAANAAGLTGQAAEDFKAKHVQACRAVRLAVRQHVQAVLESPEGQARPTAAREVALRPDLTTAQAIAILADEPEEEEDDDVRELVRRILEA